MSSKQILSLNTVLNILLVRQKTWLMKLNIALHYKAFIRLRVISVMMLMKISPIKCSTVYVCVWVGGWVGGGGNC